MNDVEYKEFIGFYRNLYPEGFCNHLISEFNYYKNIKGVGFNRQQFEGAKKTDKDDYHIFLNGTQIQLQDFEGMACIPLFFKGLQACYDDYTNNFSSLKNLRDIYTYEMKMQETKPGGGYHVWHFEQGDTFASKRVLVYMLYLNNLDSEGGETEFLHQQLRIKPEENMMLLWPASFTHVHRGNLVMGNKSKYVITGWFHFK